MKRLFLLLLFCCIATSYLLANDEYTSINWPENVSMMELEKEFSPYFVDSDFVIQPGQILIIQPGVKVLFGKDAGFTVRGRLVAKGSREKRIILAAEDNYNPWNGIYFNNSEKLNTLAYCDIKNAHGMLSNTLINGREMRAGGAISASSSSIVIEYCNITENSADKGGAVYASDSELFFQGNYITHNTAIEGGAFYFVLGKSHFIGNNIYKNTAKNIAGAMLAFGGQVEFIRNRIVDNKAMVEGGIYQEDSNIAYRFNNISRNAGQPPRANLIAEILKDLPAIVVKERQIVLQDMQSQQVVLSTASAPVALTPEEIKQKLIDSLQKVDAKLIIPSKYSPYKIDHDILVSEQGELELESGVALEMTSNVRVIIRGKITAIGKKTKMIYFSALDDKKPWRGILFYKTHRENLMNYVVVSGATGAKVHVDGASSINAGGAIAIVDSKLTASNSLFELCRSDIGGALYAENSEIYLAYNSFQKNTASQEGGALYIRKSDSKIVNNDFFENSSKKQGGAILLYGSNPDIFDNNVYENKTLDNTAVIYCIASRPKIRNNQYLKNTGRNFAIEPMDQNIPSRNVVPVF